MTKEEIIRSTNQYMFGAWKNVENAIEINITSSEASLINNGNSIDVKDDSFSSNAHWFGDYLSFATQQSFFIAYANQTEMMFGEVEIAGTFNGKNKWVLKFNRI